MKTVHIYLEQKKWKGNSEGRDVGEAAGNEWNPSLQKTPAICVCSKQSHIFKAHTHSTLSRHTFTNIYTLTYTHIHSTDLPPEPKPWLLLDHNTTTTTILSWISNTSKHLSLSLSLLSVALDWLWLWRPGCTLPVSPTFSCYSYCCYVVSLRFLPMPTLAVAPLTVLRSGATLTCALVSFWFGFRGIQSRVLCEGSDSVDGVCGVGFLVSTRGWWIVCHVWEVAFGSWNRVFEPERWVMKVLCARVCHLWMGFEFGDWMQVRRLKIVIGGIAQRSRPCDGFLSIETWPMF